MWELDYKESWAPKHWCFWTVVWRRLLRVPWTARRSNQSILKEIRPEYSLEGLMLKLKLQFFGHLTHLKRPWCWERLRAGGEEDDGGWGGWMASPTQWTQVCVSSGSWWWTGRPGVLQSMGSQRVGHNWATELNWAIPLETGCPWALSRLVTRDLGQVPSTAPIPDSRGAAGIQQKHTLQWLRCRQSPRQWDENVLGLDSGASWTAAWMCPQSTL